MGQGHGWQETQQPQDTVGPQDWEGTYGRAQARCEDSSESRAPTTEGHGQEVRADAQGEACRTCRRQSETGRKV